MKKAERTDVPAQHLFKVYVEPNGPYDNAAPIAVIAPNEYSARQRAMELHRQGSTVTDVEVKLTPKSS